MPHFEPYELVQAPIAEHYNTGLAIKLDLKNKDLISSERICKYRTVASRRHSYFKGLYQADLTSETVGTVSEVPSLNSHLPPNY
jgi:hypothetical protein